MTPNQESPGDADDGPLSVVLGFVVPVLGLLAILAAIFGIPLLLVGIPLWLILSLPRPVGLLLLKVVGAFVGGVFAVALSQVGRRGWHTSHTGGRYYNYWGDEPLGLIGGVLAFLCGAGLTWLLFF